MCVDSTTLSTTLGGNLKFKFDDIIKIVLGYVVLYALTLKTIHQIKD